VIKNKSDFEPPTNNGYKSEVLDTKLAIDGQTEEEKLLFPDK
jgi:hypothetical protein